MSAYDIYQIRQHRRLILDSESNFFLMFDGAGIKENKPIAFTMTGEDFKKCRRSVNKKTTKEFLPPGPNQQYPSEKLPLEKRWSARYFDFKDVFGEISETKANKMELDWYYDISNWGGYRSFLASDFSIETPPEALTKPHTHVKLPYREGEE